MRRHPWWFALGVLGAVIYAGSTVASAFAVGWATDRVVLPALRSGDPSSAALTGAVALIAGVTVLKAAGVVLRRVGALELQFRVQGDLRRELVDHVQRLPLSWHQGRATGDTLSVINADADASTEPLAPLPWSIGVFLLLTGAVGFLAAIDLALAGVALVLIPVAMALNRRYNERVEPLMASAQELRGKVSAVAHESFGGAVVVKTLGREPDEVERFRRVSDRLRDRLVAAGRVRAVFDATIQTLSPLALLGAVLVGAWRYSAGAISAGELVSAAYLFNLIAFPVRVIGYFLGDLARGVVGWDRVRQVLGTTDRLAYGERAPGGGGGASLAFEDVTVRLGDRDVLRDVSFSIAPGRVVAVVGRTGAGKSTITALLARLIDPDGGAVRLDGQDLRSFRREALAGDVAVVFQDAFVFDDTVRFNITLGEPFPDEEVRRAARLAQADAFIDRLPNGYETRLGEGGATVSGGERQRIALARALVRRPRLLVLDEATSAVDPSVEAAIIGALREAVPGCTVVLLGHRPAAVAAADEVIRLDDREDEASPAGLGDRPEGTAGRLVQRQRRSGP